MPDRFAGATVRLLRSRVNRVRRQMVYTDMPALIMLLVVVVLTTAAGAIWPDNVPYSALLIPMFLGSMWLGPRTLPWFIVVALVGVSLIIAAQPPIASRSIARVVVTFVLGLLILLASFRRSRLGIAGPKGEAMLVDLRDRIIRQGQIGRLPDEWYARSVLRSSGGTAFAGDFIVSNTTASGRVLQVVVVDVSGKGVEAGTRSLLLSGAFGGLLSALPSEQFLPAANDFLVRQDWAEGFATAIHLRLDLTTGDFELRKAGHPPAVWLHAGSGKWSVLDSDGPALGLLPDAEMQCVRGTLGPGDGLMLYTDGLVEDPRRDIMSGVDKLAGRGVRLLQSGFEGGEVQLVDELERTDDDRALLLVHRRVLRHTS
ncbi:MAG: PP2C family protein-serine/threonine phosphatase [Marmoricola sp.]